MEIKITTYYVHWYIHAKSSGGWINQNTKLDSDCNMSTHLFSCFQINIYIYNTKEYNTITIYKINTII